MCFSCCCCCCLFIALVVSAPCKLSTPLHTAAATLLTCFLSSLFSYQGGLLEALEADVVLVQHLVRVEVSLVVVRGYDHLLAHLAIVGPVREDDLVHLQASQTTATTPTAAEKEIGPMQATSTKIANKEGVKIRASRERKF